MTKIELKKNAFEYILFKMRKWREEFLAKKNKSRFDLSWPEELDNKNRFSRLLPFLICMATKEREKIFFVFDHFIADEDGIIEKDLDEVYKNYEKIKEKELNLPVVLCEIIDESISFIRGKNEFIIDWQMCEASFFNQRHVAWRVWFSVKKSGGDGKIPIEILIKEKSIFAPVVELMWFA